MNKVNSKMVNGCRYYRALESVMVMVMFKEHGVCPMLSLTVFKIFLSKYIRIITERVSPAVFSR